MCLDEYKDLVLSIHFAEDVRFKFKELTVCTKFSLSGSNKIFNCGERFICWVTEHPQYSETTLIIVFPGEERKHLIWKSDVENWQFAPDVYQVEIKGISYQMMISYQGYKKLLPAHYFSTDFRQGGVILQGKAKAEIILAKKSRYVGVGFYYDGTDVLEAFHDLESAEWLSAEECFAADDGEHFPLGEEPIAYGAAQVCCRGERLIFRENSTGF